ncbi:signal peptidase II [Limosilactobacillus fermentum]|uniref:signal peptidase II n=1 Tax=Limosilactobacillus fermentum TaxID=1613 RepID=UPI00135F7922|nr:signal peptidase II [Limosilactobacillus fermentum]MCD5424356.1 signal peptidase II [Limosilactobacillus fermentum]MPW02436.1 signal peptidase II [Limosilactobacillus fermentum]
MAYYLLFIVALVGLDQFVKYWVSANIALGTSHGFIPGLMNLTNLHNDGAAWSILEGQQSFFYLITLAAVVVLAYLMRQWRTNRWKMIALSLIMAGALGNFIDRVHQHYVVDMFELLPINFPVFNVADSCLTVGVIALIIIILKED